MLYCIESSICKTEKECLSVGKELCVRVCWALKLGYMTSMTVANCMSRLVQLTVYVHRYGMSAIAKVCLAGQLDLFLTLGNCC